MTFLIPPAPSKTETPPAAKLPPHGKKVSAQNVIEAFFERCGIFENESGLSRLESEQRTFEWLDSCFEVFAVDAHSGAVNR